MLIRTGPVFQSFKYAIYALLAVNTGHFFIDNFTGSEFTYSDGMKLGDVIVAYTDFIDTAAWLVLLLMLELETFVIPDERMKGWLDWSISAVSFVCWAVILYSFYGYVATLGVPMGFDAYSGPDPCTAVDGATALARSLGEYETLTAENCTLLTSPVFYNAELSMFATPENLSLIKRLAWTDVVNSGLWVLIVVILELEIYLKSSKIFGTKFFLAYKLFKVALYAILFVNAVYWWMLGAPWDAWDAFIWIVAFFFIEMNMVSWQEENAHLREAGKLD